MDAKYEAYKRHNWQGDDRWQQYMKNLYPVPPLAMLERKRKRWYKLNVDKDFDPDYNPESDQARQ